MLHELQQLRNRVLMQSGNLVVTFMLHLQSFDASILKCFCCFHAGVSVGVVGHGWVDSLGGLSTSFNFLTFCASGLHGENTKQTCSDAPQEDLTMNSTPAPNTSAKHWSQELMQRTSTNYSTCSMHWSDLGSLFLQFQQSHRSHAAG